jgi:predicted acylesterase/phospholipase RssA
LIAQSVFRQDASEKYDFRGDFLEKVLLLEVDGKDGFSNVSGLAPRKSGRVNVTQSRRQCNPVAFLLAGYVDLRGLPKRVQSIAYSENGAQFIFSEKAARFICTRQKTLPSSVPNEFFGRMLNELPTVVREQSVQIAPRLLPEGSSTPGYFDVLADSVNIMRAPITRTRLAGELPHLILTPRLRDIGLMDFTRAKKAIAEGRACVEQALPMLRRYM